MHSFMGKRRALPFQRNLVCVTAGCRDPGGGVTGRILMGQKHCLTGGMQTRRRSAHMLIHDDPRTAASSRSAQVKRLETNYETL